MVNLSVLTGMSRDSDPIMICEYDPAWPSKFAYRSARIANALGTIVRRIEHIGSTAMPDLAAKPIIDLDVVIAAEFDLPEAIRLLAAIRYVHEGSLGIAGREAFRWPEEEARHHLYVLVEGATELRRHIAFRDALRADSVLRSSCAQLKRLLADRYTSDRQSRTRPPITVLTLLRFW
jgi:GrpB-like predicted nucleotidyltransferase (UPF0157 family)